MLSAVLNALFLFFEGQRFFSSTKYFFLITVFHDIIPEAKEVPLPPSSFALQPTVFPIITTVSSFCSSHKAIVFLIKCIMML